MRFRSVVLVLSLLVSVAASAQNTLRFDPPNPTSRTPVTAFVHLPAERCTIESTKVTRTGQQLAIELKEASFCTPDILPARGADLRLDLGALPAGVYRVTVSAGATSLAETTLIVREANPRFVVEPDAVAVPGQTVRLVGPNIVSCLSGVACQHIDVRFGDVPVQVISTSPNAIVVRPPATLPPGTYDVTILRENGDDRATAAFQVGPPTEAFFERVLFPVFFSGPGAFGSVWTTHAALYNGAAFAWIAPQPSIFAASCVAPCDVVPQPRGTFSGDGPSANAGVLELVPRQITAVSDFGLLIRDLSRNAQDLGTEIPVVREDDLYDRTFQLLDVPADPRYRLTLRLYDLDGPRTFLVRVYKMGVLTAPLAERSVQLMSETSLRGGGFAVVNDLLAGIPDAARGASLRVELVPLTGTGAARTGTGLKSAWGFVTVTNNETQHVTVLSPH